MAVFGNADEDNTVRQPLDHFVELPGGQPRVVLEDVAGQVLAPTGHFLQEALVHGDAEALGAPVAGQQGLQRPRSHALFREVPQLSGPFQVLGVLQLAQQPFLRLALIRLDGGVVKAEFLEVRQDDEEHFPGVPGVAFGLHDMAGVFQRVARGLGLDKEFRLAAQPEAVVRASFLRALFYKAFPLVVEQALLVVHIPAQGLEEGIDEVNAGLRFRVIFRQVMGGVGFELADEFLEVVPECL